MRTSEPVAISSIFARRAGDGDYTYSASLYQNILRYSIALKHDKTNYDQSFTWWEITDWLTANKNDSADKRAKERIENPQKTIKNKLKNLVKLELLKMTEARPITKGAGTTPTYQFTDYGHLIALIIESFTYKTSQEFTCICDEMYNLLCNIFPVEEDSTFSTSTTIFLSKIIKKCKEKGVFDQIVMLFSDTLTQNTRHIVKIVDLFRRVIMFGFKDKMTRNAFKMLFDETINELDFDIKRLVLYNLKLDIENKMKESVQYRDAYEIARYRLRGIEDTVAVEGYCWICDRYISTHTELLDYRASIVDPILGTIAGKCPICSIDGAFQIAAVL